MKIIFKCAVAIIVSTALFGCGYKLSGAESTLPKGVKSIAVGPFENLTLEPDVGVMLAEAMQREILRRKMVKLEPVDKADAVLEGKVEEVRLDPQAYDENGFTTAYRVRMVVSAKLSRGTEVIWSVNRLIKEEDIAVKGVIPDNKVRRARALAATAEDIAEQIHIKMAEGW